MNSRTILRRRRHRRNHDYSNQDIRNAIALIRRRQCSIRQAAQAYNIPRTTLTTYLSRLQKLVVTETMQPHEEQTLHDWMTDCCKRGFTVRKRCVEAAAELLMKKGGGAARKQQPFGDAGQYEAFLKRWLAVEAEKERKFVGAVPDWFAHIEAYLAETHSLEIMNDSSRVFLCDEFKFKERMDIPSSIKDALTDANMLYTVTAAGDVLQPLIVYPYKGEIPDQIVKAAPRNCAIVPQQHGTVTPKILIAYLKKVLQKYLEQCHIATPVIMFVDESQIDPTMELTSTCKNLGIILLGLSCQVLKPTINLFRGLATGWSTEVNNWCATGDGRTFSIIECARIMQLVNQRYIQREEICRDFGDSALFPWNRAADCQDEEQELERFLEDFDDDDDDDEDYTMDEDAMREYMEVTKPAEVPVEEASTPPIAADTKISLRYDEFDKLLGSELAQKLDKDFGSATAMFSSRAERALFDIYRRFREAAGPAVVGPNRKNAVIEVVEIIDD
ncbi:hypothetical protein quinque_000869 [Culex quinquefasciatus]|uniref:uncharacterized protein LOC6045171 n=1 Tax=Culex quinquefasciatus TaxID=7176 RepID=UPI0018E2DD72|nr:uncharacterized protein LOC6045171 [Culex quinquefasciatus]